MAVSAIPLKSDARNCFGTSVDVSDYTSTYYTFPSDGYVVASCGSTSGSKCILAIRSADDNATFYHGSYGNSTYAQIALYVKKGMKVKAQDIGNGGKALFFPFI